MYRLCCEQGSQDASQGYSQGPLTQGGGLSQPGLSLSQPGLSQTELSQVRKSTVPRWKSQRIKNHRLG
jgi:hypothetical protein